MAYVTSGLSAINVSNKNTGGLYQYKEAATLATLRGANYFNNAVDDGLEADDVLMLIASDGIGFSQVNVSGVNYTLDENITSS